MVANGGDLDPAVLYGDHPHAITVRDRGSDAARVPVLSVHRNLSFRGKLTDRAADIADETLTAGHGLLTVGPQHPAEQEASQGGRHHCGRQHHPQTAVGSTTPKLTLIAGIGPSKSISEPRTNVITPPTVSNP